MLISKFDLYKPEWLELVFADRNKAYGAYELRQHYHRTMATAMGLTFLSIGILCAIGSVFSHPPVIAKPVPKDPVITITLHPPHKPAGASSKGPAIAKTAGAG